MTALAHITEADRDAASEICAHLGNTCCRACLARGGKCPLQGEVDNKDVIIGIISRATHAQREEAASWRRVAERLEREKVALEEALGRVVNVAADLSKEMFPASAAEDETRALREALRRLIDETAEAWGSRHPVTDGQETK